MKVVCAVEALTRVRPVALVRVHLAKDSAERRCNWSPKEGGKPLVCTKHRGRRCADGVNLASPWFPLNQNCFDLVTHLVCPAHVIVHRALAKRVRWRSRRQVFLGGDGNIDRTDGILWPPRHRGTEVNKEARESVGSGQHLHMCGAIDTGNKDRSSVVRWLDQAQRYRQQMLRRFACPSGQ